MAELREIKTDKFTLDSGHLDVEDGHKVYYEQWGNPVAPTPILLFHGGPGGAFKAKYKYNFDPLVHQIILFDQRGGGNSLPYGELLNNTTQDLINDAVKILDHLDIKSVYVQGGSWGSTLALLFTIKHNKRVKATVVNGVFSASKTEINYVDKGIYRQYYPEVWEKIVSTVPDNHRDNPVEYHYNILAGKDEAKIARSAKALQDMERPLLKFDWGGYETIYPDKDPNNEEPEFDFVPYRIYAHYLSNDCFLEDKFILKNISNVKTPLYIVQGRYDMVCPPITAHELHKSAKNSRLYMTLASHDRDPETRTALKTLADTVFISNSTSLR